MPSPMADIVMNLESITSILLPSPSSQLTQTLENRSFAYESMLQLQRHHTSQPIDALPTQTLNLLPAIVMDISMQDEELAALALKCLGFAIYHPSIVSGIPEVSGYMVLESLSKLIINTKIKAICNLGVWCLSVQQFNFPIVDSFLHSILRAIIHALENPFGSLSVTYEATQAVVKWATQFRGKMKEMACIWVPPIYKRLISVDKKERDMAERCMLKIESIIFPSALTLSKVVNSDLNQTLHTKLMDMIQDNAQILMAIQAWKWYIRMLGPGSIKKRNIINKMLKVLEKTFSDPNHQVRTATLVAWESLIDMLVPQQTLDFNVLTCVFHSNPPKEDMLRKIKLLINPLIKIMSSKWEASTLSSCLNTWYHLLHKLEFFTTHWSVLSIVLEPVLDAVFIKGPGGKNAWLWDSCVQLFDEFVQSKAYGEVKSSYQSKNTSFSSHVDSKVTGKNHFIKWPHWELSDIGFFLMVIRKLTDKKLMIDLSVEKRTLSFGAALRIFKSVLKGIQDDLRLSSDCLKKSCISAILCLVRELVEYLTSTFTDVIHWTFLQTSLQFVDVVISGIDHSILSSTRYSVPLDINYIRQIQSTMDIRYPKVPGITFLAWNDMVTPIVYLTVLYFCVASHSLSKFQEVDEFLNALSESKIIFFPCVSIDNIDVVISILYMHGKELIPDMIFSLKMWKMLSENLKGYLCAENDLVPLFTPKSNEPSCAAMLQFLCYPVYTYIVSSSFCESVRMGSVMLPMEHKIKFNSFLKTWRSLLDSSLCALQADASAMSSFVEGLCELLLQFVDGDATILQTNDLDMNERKSQPNFIIVICVDVLICIEKQIHHLQAKKFQPSIFDIKLIKVTITFVSSFLSLSLPLIKVNLQVYNMIIPSMFSSMTSIFCCCCKHDTPLALEAISNPLVAWLSPSTSMSNNNVRQESIPISEVRLLWTNILEFMQRTKPSVIFDSHLLKLQAPLFQVTLDHPYYPISAPTVSFWNATYGKKQNLHYPLCLLPVIQKLSTKGVVTSVVDGFPVGFMNPIEEDTVNYTKLGYESMEMMHFVPNKRVKLIEEHGRMDPALKQCPMRRTPECIMKLLRKR